MTAGILLRLWKLRLWVGIGGVVAIAAAVASTTMLHSVVYASASTKMLVDSPRSALANAGADLSGYLTRANVFARLATSNEALQYIGQAAGVPGNLIAASGPVEVNGSLPSTHAPTPDAGQKVPANLDYKLQFNQNPEMPTVDVYAEAPTTKEAVALANGAVTGFDAFLNHLYANSAIASYNRIEIRQLGGAAGGIVDPAASKKLALFVFVGVFAAWCALVLFVSRLRAQMRTTNIDDDFTRSPGPGDLPEEVRTPVAEPQFAEQHSAGQSGHSAAYYPPRPPAPHNGHSAPDNGFSVPGNEQSVLGDPRLNFGSELRHSRRRVTGVGAEPSGDRSWS
jgi:hypothetical protein